jgi:hypothetical protein
MVALADGIAAVIAREGAEGGWPVRIGRQAGTSARSIAIMELPGSAPEVKVAINYPSLQLLVRGDKTEYAVTRDRAQALFEALHAIDTPDTDFPELTACLAIHDPGFIGYDDLERPMFSLNFRCILSKPATDNRPL